MVTPLLALLMETEKFSAPSTTPSSMVGTWMVWEPALVNVSDPVVLL